MILEWTGLVKRRSFVNLYTPSVMSCELLHFSVYIHVIKCELDKVQSVEDIHPVGHQLRPSLQPGNIHHWMEELLPPQIVDHTAYTNIHIWYMMERKMKNLLMQTTDSCFNLFGPCQYSTVPGVYQQLQQLTTLSTWGRPTTPSWPAATAFIWLTPGRPLGLNRHLASKCLRVLS